jgi:hypothetical protein
VTLESVRSVEDLAAALRLAEVGEQLVCAVTADRVAFEAVIEALRDDWIDVTDARVATGAEQLARTSDGPATEAVWIELAPEQLSRIDPMRTALLPRGAVLLGCSEDTHNRLRAAAPHFCSLIVPFARVSVSDDAHGRARDTLLHKLREHYSMSDEELITKVRADALDLGPDHALWLVLIGHGALIRSEAT